MRKRQKSRAAIARRRYAEIERFNSLTETAKANKVGPTVSAEEFIQALEDGRDPFAAMKGAP